MAVEAIKNGADEFIQKPFQDVDLLAKVYQALEKDQRQQQDNEHSVGISARFQQLTEREKQVMEQMFAGHANKVIAIELGISQRTVEIHRAHVMHKTKAKSLVHLVKMALLTKVMENP